MTTSTSVGDGGTAAGGDAASGASAAADAAEESRQLALYDVILSVSQAHHANCGTTEECVKALVRKPFSLVGGTWRDAPVGRNDRNRPKKTMMKKQFMKKKNVNKI